jgi:hypothetical protein
MRHRLSLRAVSIGTLLVSLSGIRAASSAAQSLVARQVTLDNSADLFSGSEAVGGIGDWYLSNGVIQAIVDEVGYQEDVFRSTGRYLPLRTLGFTGGALIDLGLVGHDDDQFGWLSQIVDFDGHSPVLYVPASYALRDVRLPSIRTEVDEVAGTASLTVYGMVYFPVGSPFENKLIVETRYSVRRGESVLRVETTVTNKASSPAPVSSIVDTVWLGTGGLHAFTPVPDGGFDLSSSIRLFPFVSLVGALSPDDGIVDTARGLATGEVSYTLSSPQYGFLSGKMSTALLEVGPAPGESQLDPGASIVYDRRIAVGDRNDVASSADALLAGISTSLGASSGILHGRLTVPDGMPFRASLELSLRALYGSTPATPTILSLANGDTRPEPLTQIFTSGDRGGSFEAVLPAGTYELRVSAEERPNVNPRELTIAPGAVTDVGDVVLPALGRLTYHVTEGGPGGAAIPAKITIKGRLPTSDPLFGLPVDEKLDGVVVRQLTKQSDPAINMTYTTDGEGELFLKPGDYIVFASRGMEYDFDARAITIVSGQTTDASLSISHVVDTSGYVSADFHVHAARSADSSVPPLDRVKNFAAEGVDVIVATEHNLIFDYRSLIAQLGLESRLASIVGVETSMSKSSPEGPPFGNLGHWNGWPLAVKPNERKDGAPEEGYVQPNVVFDRLREAGAEVIELNHPFRGALGYLAVNGFDPSLPVGDGPNAFLLRESTTGSGTRNIDFDAIEIYNGSDIGFAAYRAGRAAWFSMLNQGLRKVATAVTDTHSVAMRHGGFPRSYVADDVADMRDLDVKRFDDALKEGRLIGTSGPFVRVRATTSFGSAGLGETLTATAKGVALAIEVQAPCWIPVEEIRVFANGQLIARTALAPGCTSPLRYSNQLQFLPSVDTYYVVEAGQKLPIDGSEPPWPTGIMSVLEPAVLSLAFTNPIFIDVDGNGKFDPPMARSTPP